jgi:HPt (histidine-containing phosphotransfer) domain-containing protein
VIEDLQAKFLPRFIELARSRVERAIEIATRNDQEAAASIARELHALVGEAGLLGLATVVPLARDCESKAKRVGTSRSPEDAAALIAALRELGIAIELVGPGQPAKEPSHV